MTALAFHLIHNVDSIVMLQAPFTIQLLLQLFNHSTIQFNRLQ